MQHPIDMVKWVDVDLLQANEYNPNVVQSQEFKLLEFSLLTNGWIQPVLVADASVDGNERYVIIDGFHRSTLAKTSKRVREMSGGKVPVVVMNLSEPERILLTIRINRAKGTHMAFKMADNIKMLSDTYSMADEDIMQGIGCNRVELELLKTENVFKHLNVENTPYSKAWYPLTSAKKDK